MRGASALVRLALPRLGLGLEARLRLRPRLCRRGLRRLELLELIVQLEADLNAMSESNQELSAELAKREDALKRLRELTLGQPEG